MTDDLSRLRYSRDWIDHDFRPDPGSGLLAAYAHLDDSADFWTEPIVGWLVQVDDVTTTHPSGRYTDDARARSERERRIVPAVLSDGIAYDPSEASNFLGFVRTKAQAKKAAEARVTATETVR